MLKNRKRWDAYKPYERKAKEAFLKGLSQKQSFEILSSLYKIFNRFLDKNAIRRQEMQKIKTLRDIHMKFNKVK